MPAGAQVAFHLGVFCCFAPIGLLQGAITLAIEPWWTVALVSVFSGAVAVAYVFTVMRWPAWFPLVVAGHIGLSILLGRVLPDGERPTSLDAAGLAALATRLRILVMLTVASTITAYVAFLTLIRREGLRFSSAFAELRLARQIHASLVPLVEGREGGLAWRGASQPSGDVGGDLVDVVSNGRGWHACVADVSGHGVAAGVLMGMFKAAFRASLDDATDLGDLLTRLNRTIGPLREPHMFITAVCVRIATPDRFEFVLAGHPSILHFRGADFRAEWVGESQPALGLIDNVTYTSHTREVRSGDTLVLVTDGLLEVFDRHDRELGPDGVRAVVEQAARAGGTTIDIERALFEACRRHGTQLDDQTLLALRIEG